MAAVVVDDTRRPAVQGRLASIRHHLGKPPGTVLHFASNIKEHGARVYVCQELGSLGDVTITNVVMCKRLWTSAPLLTADVSAVYLYALRFMLERLSWIARDRQDKLIITLRPRKELPLSAPQRISDPTAGDAHKYRMDLDSGHSDQPAHETGTASSGRHRRVIGAASVPARPPRRDRTAVPDRAVASPLSPPSRRDYVIRDEAPPRVRFFPFPVAVAALR